MNSRWQTYNRSLSVRSRNQMTRSGRMDPAGIVSGASRNPSQVGFAVEHRVSSMCLLAFTCICTRKTIQVQRYLGHRLSLSHNLRPDGISRNACPCNRTVGTGGSVRNGAVEIGQREVGMRRLEGKRAGWSCLAVRGPMQFHACRGGCNWGGIQETTKGRREAWRIRVQEGHEGRRGVDGDGRRADSILWSVQYVPICRHVLSIPPEALLPPCLRTSCHTI